MKDKNVYRALQMDDPKVVNFLFDKYFQDLCFYSFQITKTKEISEEVVADVFTNIWRNRKSFLVINLKSYLYKSVKNGSLQAIKNRRPYLTIDDINLDSVLQTTDIESQIVEKELLDYTLRIIDKMPEQRKIIFKLNRINGLRYKEIADILNISVSTVQNQMVKAIQFIHQSFSKKPTSI